MLPGVEAGDVRAIHRARVASRRLRELLPVLQLDGKTADKLGRRLRRVTRRLGEVRELDVLLAVLGEVRVPAGQGSRMLGYVAGDIRRARDAAQRKRIGRGLALELHRIGRKLGAAADALKDNDDGGDDRRAWRWAADARVARRGDALRKAIADAGALYLPERLHAVRIALKKLRYAVEVAADASGDDRSRELRLLKRVQGLLGRLHDLQVLIDRARRAQAAAGTADLAMWREFDQLLASLEQACRRLHARYVRERAALVDVCGREAARSSRSRHAAERRAS
jgi:CHAD domain-containing protein